MKITALKTWVVPPRWLFLKIETDAEIFGWGEPGLEGHAERLCHVVERLSREFGMEILLKPPRLQSAIRSLPRCETGVMIFGKSDGVGR